VIPSRFSYEIETCSADKNRNSSLHEALASISPFHADSGPLRPVELVDMTPRPEIDLDDVPVDEETPDELPLVQVFNDVTD
jgi:hypothetical protein